jgi:hypothetical protein
MRQETYECGSGTTWKKRKPTKISNKDRKEDILKYSKSLKSFEQILKDLAESCRQRLRACDLPDTNVNH